MMKFCVFPLATLKAKALNAQMEKAATTVAENTGLHLSMKVRNSIC